MSLSEILFNQHWLLSIVFTVLILLSFVSWYLIFKKFFFFRGEITLLTTDPESHDFIKQAFVVVENNSDRDLTNRKLGLILEQYKDHLHFGQNFLASVANLTPFIGLFGTVIGVYLALIDVSASGSANIAIVAKPIGEALVATAIGLWCAIPASFAYNFYSKKAASALKKIRMLVEQKLIDVAEKK